MLWGFKQLRCRSFLNQLSLLHHHDMVCVAPYDGQVVGDQQDGHAQLLLQVFQQFQYLLLDSDVECRCRLVRDQQVRLVGEGHGNHYALLLAAGELMRVARQALFRRGDADQIQ